MAKKHRVQSKIDAAAHAAQVPQSGAGAFVWLPAIALAIIPVYEIAQALQAHDYAHRAFFVHNDTLNFLSQLCFGLAALMAVVPPLRRAVGRHLDGLSRLPLRVHLAWVGLGFAGVVAWLGFIRWCQYRAFLLPQDTTCNVNTAYTFLHHGVLEWPIWGMKVFSLHFIYLWAVFSPVLLAWNNPAALLFVQNLFVASAPFAAYALAALLTSSSMAGFVGMILTLSAPVLYELLTSNMHNAALCAFLPWAMFFLYLRMWWIAALFVFLMIGSVEQVPFIFIGMGLYAMCALRDRRPRNWIYGTAISTAALALFVIEQRVKKHYAGLEGITNFMGAGQWELLRAMVPAGVTEAQVPREMLDHPLRTFSMMLSIYKYFPVLRALFSVGFLPLLAPFNLLPFLMTVFPQVMAAPPGPVPFFDYHPITYHDFGLHHGSYMFGPLIWAAAFGIERAYAKLSARGWQSWLVVWALAVSGMGFKYCHRTLNPNWRPTWFDAMPPLIARIPPRARVWADEYASAPLSNRRWIKITQWGPEEPVGFDSKLFKPDYVLFDKAFAMYAKPPYRDRLLTFFAQNGYVKDAERNDAVLLQSPSPDPDPESVPQWIRLPEPDPKLAEPYARYLLSSN